MRFYEKPLVTRRIESNLLLWAPDFRCVLRNDTVVEFSTDSGFNKFKTLTERQGLVRVFNYP